MYKNSIKRIIDFLIALIAIIVLSPVLLLIGLLVKIKIGSPIIFKQQRPGKDGKAFTIFKFRTMTNKTDANGSLLPDGERLTKFGEFLRNTSLDELPELFNILIGTMAFVGPRPQLFKDMVFFSEETMNRQTVRPGLTGLAQINGRNNISWEDKFKYDLEYLDNINIINDFKIMLTTVIKVFKKEDINTEGMATCEDYGDYLLRVGKITEPEYIYKINTLKEEKTKKEKLKWLQLEKDIPS